MTLILRGRPFFSAMGDLGDLSSALVEEMEEAEE